MGALARERDALDNEVKEGQEKLRLSSNLAQRLTSELTELKNKINQLASENTDLKRKAGESDGLSNKINRLASENEGLMH